MLSTLLSAHLRMRGPTPLVLLCLFGALFTSVAYAGEPIHISRKLLDAMKDVESGGDECLRGDNGRSLGAYQIMKKYHNDAIEFNPRLREGGKTYRSVAGIGSSHYSELVIMSYMGRYATRERLGRDPTDQDIARIHNGGPGGYRKTATLSYWNKVKSRLSGGINKRDVSGNVFSPACNAGECCSSTGVCSCLNSVNTSLIWQPCTLSGSKKIVIGMAGFIISTISGLIFNMG